MALDAVEQMKVPLLFIRGKLHTPNCRSVCLILSDIVGTHFLKCATFLENKFFDKEFHSLDHDHEIITIIIHESQIGLAECSNPAL